MTMPAMVPAGTALDLDEAVLAVVGLELGFVGDAHAYAAAEVEDVTVGLCT